MLKSFEVNLEFWNKNEVFLNLRKYLHEGIFVRPEVIHVSGVPSHLIDSIVTHLNFPILYTKNNNPSYKLLIKSITKVDKDIKYKELLDLLERLHYKRSEYISDIGEYMVRGDTITIYPYAYDRNIKVSFFDKEVEEIRLTDRVDPTEFSKIKSFYLFNNSFLLDNIDKELFESNSNEFKNVLLIFSNDKEHLSKEDHVFHFDYAFPPIYLSHLELLRKDIQNYQEKGYEVYTNIDKEEIFGSVKVKHMDIDVSSGFIDNSSKILFLSEKEVFGNIKKVSTKKGDNFFDQNIKIGDYIVHEDYGIGIYKDIVKKNNEEYFLLEYAASDKLYVPLTQINKLTKYLGEGGIAPHITRLGKTEWEHIKSRVKKSVENIARELLLHFALQQSSEAKSFTSKTPMYEEMCNDFPYELTLDQEIAVKEINRDLASTKPMNRLLIGDVGFGKTEVALRAAFRVIEDGSQVALLAPTTILVYQHYNLFKERFEKFGIKVGMVSSFNTSKENTEILNRLEKKEIDLIIGTHRLLSKDVKIPKLALLIVDEEQRFGVKQKEKIKALRYGTHILTLSATPIPRTLSLALSKLQDLSVITTPPPGRKAVETFVHKLDMDEIKSAIQMELKRKGQIYFVHNNISSIYGIAKKLKDLIPSLRVAIAHGRMKSKDFYEQINHSGTLEKIILDFYEKKYDVLLCTTIIENGIDMPNVNTVIIDKAQNLGLSQLYQIRGRVGRSDKQAYCHIFYEGDELTNDDSEKKYIERLKAIMESKELGSGFKLATRDLQIRGAGNVLGSEQSGKMNEIGYSLYIQLLEEEISKLKAKQA